MLLFLDSSFLLSYLLKFILFCQSVKHLPPEFLLHSLLFLSLPSFFLLCLFFCDLHLHFLPEEFLALLLLLFSHLGLVLLLVKLSSQGIHLFCFTPSYIFLFFQFGKNFIFGFFFFLLNLLNSLIPRIKLLDISQILLIFSFLQFFFFLLLLILHL